MTEILLFSSHILSSHFLCFKQEMFHRTNVNWLWFYKQEFFIEQMVTTKQLYFADNVVGS